MDGRTQDPVSVYLKKKYAVDYVDTITEPGPNGILARGEDASAIASIKHRIGISTGKHGSKHIAVVGHHDCAGNPVPKEKQFEQVKAAVKTIESWGFAAEVIGLWVDENWEVMEI